MRFPLLTLLCAVGTACRAKDEPAGDTSSTIDTALTDADRDGYTVEDGDCDDSDDAIHPNVIELCDGVDNNCNGEIDEGATTTFYADQDGDGFGDPSSTVEGCEPPSGTTATGTDCDDLDPESWPGAPELCDGADNDCNGEIDEGVTETFYGDGDGDGYGDPGSPTAACQPGSGLVANSEDCDDSEPASFPGAEEVCDGLDNDCDGLGDILGLWSLEAGTGSVAYDSGGLGLDGDIQGATWTTAGYRGGALEFDGVSASVVLDHEALAPEHGLTLSAWVKPDSLHSTSWDSIITRGASGSSKLECCGDSYFLGYYLYGLSFYTDTAGNGAPLLNGESHTDHVGSWHHIVATWDAESGTRALYLDGALSATDTDGPLTPYYDGTPTRIGGDTNSSTMVLPFDGIIDEVMILDCALSAVQVAQDYAGGWP